MLRMTTPLASVFISAALAVTAVAQVQTPTLPGQVAQTPPRDPNAPVHPPTAAIRGRIFDAGSGQPLRRATVRVTAPETRENRMVTTDEQGRYEFTDLAASRYTIMATKGGYLTLFYGQTRPNEGGRPLDLKDGEVVEKVDITLPYGGVITGVILDQDGDPVPNARVAALRYEFYQGRRQLMPAGRPASTDDMGEYRLYSLAPGQYYVAASLRGTLDGDFEDNGDRSGFARTYFPGTTTTASAQRLTIGVAQVLPDINIALSQIRTVRVSGTAVNAEGRPMSPGFITPVESNPASNGFVGVGIRPDGAFTIAGLVPGEYTLNAMKRTGSTDPPETASTTITVGDQDLSDVRLVADRYATVAGRLVVEPAAASALQPSTFRIMLTPVPYAPMLFPNFRAGINDDLSFEEKSPPGRYTVQLNGPAGWTLKAVRINGSDVTDSGIEIKAGREIRGIEIEVTNRLTEVTGSVTDDRGALSKDCTVVVFARDEQRWTGTSRYLRTGRPDQDGRFKIAGLPPGEYLAVALQAIDQDEATDPEILDRLRLRATAFSLDDGGIRVLELRLTNVQ